MFDRGLVCKNRLKSLHLTFGTYFLHNNKLHQDWLSPWQQKCARVHNFSYFRPCCILFIKSRYVYILQEQFGYTPIETLVFYTRALCKWSLSVEHACRLLGGSEFMVLLYASNGIFLFKKKEKKINFFLYGDGKFYFFKYNLGGRAIPSTNWPSNQLGRAIPSTK